MQHRKNSQKLIWHWNVSWAQWTLFLSMGPWNPVLYSGSASNSKTKLKIQGDYCWKGVYLQLYCSNLKYFDLCVSHNGIHFLITTTFDELTPWKNYSFKINDYKNLPHANYVHIYLMFIFFKKSSSPHSTRNPQRYSSNASIHVNMHLMVHEL